MHDIGLVLPHNKDTKFKLVSDDTAYIDPLIKRIIVLLVFHTSDPNLLMPDGSSIFDGIVTGTTSNVMYVQNRLNDISIYLKSLLDPNRTTISGLSITVSAVDTLLYLDVKCTLIDNTTISGRMVYGG